MKNRIPAFSITELVVAMCISAVVISIGYQGILLLSKYYRSQVETANFQSKEKTIMAAIHYDFVSAERIFEANKSIFFYDGNRKTQYSVYLNYTTRLTENVTDTFHFCMLELSNRNELKVRVGENESVILVKAESANQKIARLEI